MPLFTSLLNYRHSTHASGTSIDIGIEGVKVLSYIERNNYPFTVCVDDQSEGFSLTTQCQDIAPERINAYLERALATLSAALLHHPEQDALFGSMLPSAERARVMDEFNSYEVAYERKMLVHQLFEKQHACNRRRPRWF